MRRILHRTPKIIIAGLVVFVMTWPLAASAAGRMLVIMNSDTSAKSIERMHERDFQREGEEYLPPSEPRIDKVTFLKVDPPQSLKQKVDGLLLAFYTDVPPEYDHYGYEIRRYMAHIAGREVLDNAERIKVELANIANAKIIYDYWRRDLTKKISDIKLAIEADPDTPTDIRTTFKYNSGLAVAFLTECRAWLEINQKILEFLLEKQGRFTYKDPIIKFDDRHDYSEFMSLYTAQQKALTEINQYMPFALMVY